MPCLFFFLDRGELCLSLSLMTVRNFTIIYRIRIDQANTNSNILSIFPEFEHIRHFTFQATHDTRKRNRNSIRSQIRSNRQT